ncbi:putative F-box protein At1g53370 [Rutidosis leptorrhynchoides]|uniref:putative F-box protein At1g53370 n=1 Tax=Rutidosis leptorrhynchoides TaxID=125765 RepID=UPI003A99E0B0
MSDYYLPLEIQIEIIKKLPVKPLIQFRSVSKSWKSLIDSSEFIANYHFNNDQLQHHRVLVRYSSSINPTKTKYVSIVDDGSFPRDKIRLIVPSNIRRLLGKNPSILGSSQGVLACASISVIFLTVPMRFGFGVSPRTSVPKLVKITFISRSPSIKNRTPQVEIFSLSLGSWRRSLSTNVPRKSIDLDRNHVCVDKCIYLYAFDRTVTGETYQNKNLILSFDMTTEEFSEIDLCDGLKEEYAGDAYGCYGYLSISKLGTSLVVLQPKDGYYEEHSVWRMEHGVPNSFTKLFVIKSPIESLRIHRVHDFRKPGEPIIKTKKLVVFEPESGEISDIGNSCCDYSSIAKSYIVTLVLLDS